MTEPTKKKAAPKPKKVMPKVPAKASTFEIEYTGKLAKMVDNDLWNEVLMLQNHNPYNHHWAWMKRVTEDYAVRRWGIKL